MLQDHEIRQLEGSTAYGRGDEKLGNVAAIYLDDATDRPAWATVNTGLFGTKQSFVPLQEASVSDDRLYLPYDKDKVKGAPNVESDAHISPEEERELYSYYGVTWESADYEAGVGQSQGNGNGYESADRTSDDAMTRSEERVNVDTQSQEAGRARLRKYVVTENVTQQVPVRRERAVLEREPITDDNVGQATDGPSISEAEHEVVLHEERPVVSKTAEPVERVRLGTEEETAQETVSTDVRKEEIEAEGDVNR